MRWLIQLFARRRRYDEISELIHEHIDEKVSDLMDRGMTQDEAEHAARRQFGNVTRIEEQSREVWQWPTLESILSDPKYAVRQMRKAPGFSAVVVIILALGIGANTTVFSIVDAVMLRPLPFAQPQRLVEVKASEEQHFESRDVSYPDFFDWRTQARSFEYLLSYHDTSDTLTGVSHPVRLDGEVVSWEMVSSTSDISRFRPSRPAMFSPLRPWSEYTCTISMLWAAAYCRIISNWFSGEYC
jgi:hypothetical protein